jgi:hypothetical protein
LFPLCCLACSNRPLKSLIFARGGEQLRGFGYGWAMYSWDASVLEPCSVVGRSAGSSSNASIGWLRRYDLDGHVKWHLGILKYRLGIHSDR